MDYVEEQMNENLVELERLVTRHEKVNEGIKVERAMIEKV